MKVYSYAGCGTCKKALAWLQRRGITPTEVVPIRERPPTLTELRRARDAVGLKKLFNTSGGDYKALGLKDRLPAMPEAEALALLAAHGNLVKRPFVVHAGGVLVGFDEAAWAAALGPR